MRYCSRIIVYNFESWCNMVRRLAREQAFILLFEKCFHEDLSFDEIIENAQMADDFEHDEFCDRLANGVYANLVEIDKLITENLTAWKINRIPKVTLCLLRLAVYEMKFEMEIPVSVSINESVELAKKFATTDDASYINGVLGSIARAGEEK